jgi:hypothetical protein
MEVMMNEPMQKRPPGRPSANSMPVIERVESAPTADHMSKQVSAIVENAPIPMIDISKTEQIDRPDKIVEPKKEHKWYKLHIDLGPSTDKIKINEQEFHHGQIVTIRDDLLPVLNEVMYNTKMHERVVKGEVTPMGRLAQR